MAYTVPTLLQAKAALAARLQDSSMVRWTSDELGVYLTEAIRTWQAWTAHWRETGTFNTVPMEPFYDLAVSFPTLRGMTVTNHDVVAAIQYHLLEPATPAGWTGTDQFTLAQVSVAVQRRRDLFLQQTGAILTRSVTNYPAPPATGRIPLDESVLSVSRAAWRPDATQFLRILQRADEWGADHYRRTWPQVTTPPRAFSVAGTPPLELQLMPVAAAAGSLDLVSVTRGNQFANPAVASLLGVPDDWSWVVKFGALADLLGGDGLALDPTRAAYCESRWAQGVSMAQSAGVVLSARISDVPVIIGNLTDADRFSPTWQLVGGVPKRVLTAGQNLLATWPPAGADGVVIGLEVVRNAPVPVADADVLQVGADLYDTILDLAQSLAVFKEGPQQNQVAQALVQRAASAAGITLALQQAAQPARSAMVGQNRTDALAAPREAEPVEIP